MPTVTDSAIVRGVPALGIAEGKELLVADGPCCEFAVETATEFPRLIAHVIEFADELFVSLEKGVGHRPPS